MKKLYRMERRRDGPGSDALSFVVGPGVDECWFYTGAEATAELCNRVFEEGRRRGLEELVSRIVQEGKSLVDERKKVNSGEVQEKAGCD